MTKKKLNLSTEKMSDLALVPENEWPYQVPENWVWVKLGSICKITNGEKRQGFDLPYLEVKVLRGKKKATIKSTGEFITCGSKVILVDGENSGEVFHIDVDGYMGSTFRVLKITDLVSDDYVEYFISMFKDDFKNSKVGSAIPHLNKGLFNNLSFSFPPLAEQQRIVDRIESLFEKLNYAKGLVQEALESFENRKAAILHKAFNGDLTKKWREENGIGIESWQETTLGSVCSSIFDGDHMPPPKSDIGVPFLVISNVNKGVLVFENTRFVSKTYFDKLTETRKPKYGDVLYTIVGSYGIPVIVDTEKEFCFQRHMALLKPKHIKTKFLWYLLKTEMIYQRVSDIANGTAQLTVPIKGLRQISFRLPTEKEQNEIVKILDEIIGRETLAYKSCDIVDDIDVMKKSILTRAFRGELGTNDPLEKSVKRKVMDARLLNGDN